MKITIKICLCVLVLFKLSTIQATQAIPRPTQTMQNTDQVLQNLLDHPSQSLASLSVIAIKEGKIVYEKQFGQRYIHPHDASKNLATDSTTLYRIASVSKMIASIGAMILVEQGKLDLDEDISRYLGFQVSNPHFPEVAITTRMLLSHTSSLRDQAGYHFPQHVTLKNFLVPGNAHYGDGSQWDSPNKQSNRSPGHFFQYVNLNWGVIGSIMEAVSGQRFDFFMRDQLLRPLGIQGGYNPEELSEEERSNIAVLYRKKKEHDTIWNPTGPWIAQVDDYRTKPIIKRHGIENYVLGSNATLFSPQGGLRISVRGLGRLMQMLMNEGELEGVRVLQASSIQQLLTEQWRYKEHLHNGDNYQGLFLSWGLGLQHFIDVSAAGYGDRLVNSHSRLTGYGHLGEAYGLNSGFIFNPASRNGIIYAIGGTSADSELLLGDYSSLSPWEEKILTALHTEIMRK